MRKPVPETAEYWETETIRVPSGTLANTSGATYAGQVDLMTDHDLPRQADRRPWYLDEVWAPDPDVTHLEVRQGQVDSSVPLGGVHPYKQSGIAALTDVRWRGDAHLTLYGGDSDLWLTFKRRRAGTC